LEHRDLEIAPTLEHRDLEIDPTGDHRDRAIAYLGYFCGGFRPGARGLRAAGILARASL
jgi:hypothetical protein